MKIQVRPMGIMMMFIVGCAWGSAGQSIEQDQRKWWRYDITYEGGTVLLLVPPHHRFQDQPRSFSKQFVASNLFLNQIFSAQYDYGWRRWSNIAQFEVVYTLVRLVDPLSDDAPLPEFRSSVNKALRLGLGYPSAAERQVGETVELDGTAWVHNVDSEDPTVESYVRRCGSQFALIVSPFFGEDLLRNSEWRANRQALFRRMVATVRCS